MIGSLRGKIFEVHPAYVLVEVQGVGYIVKASLPALSALKAGDEHLFYIHDHVREDARDLYGFATQEELAFFQKLISISGVGPKVALTIMSAGKIDNVRRAVMAGDLATLTSVPGVGTKTAQKIILELKGQLVDEQGANNEDREVIEALVSLGYSTSQAREAVKLVDVSITSTSERVRTALRNLSK